MNLELSGKIALITGSSKGLGFNIAEYFLAEGATVILNGTTKKNLDRAMNELSKKYNGKVKSIHGDVTSIKESKKICNFINKIYGYIDILVANVGSGISPKIGDETINDWQKSLELNLYSSVNIIKYSEELLKNSPSKDRSIVCISSICGHESLGAPLAYSSSKAALNSYVNSLSRYLAEHKIRINAVSPGNLLFPGSTWENKIKENKKLVYEYIEKEVALKRFGSKDDISPLVCFLASPRSSFTTGSIMVVDGGQLKSW